jgi:hypothetical protein
LECQGAYTLKEASLSRHNSIPHLGNETGLRRSGLPQSISSNTLVASLATLRLLALLHHPGPLVRDIKKYQGEEETVTWGTLGDCQDECVKRMWTGTGDTHSVPLGKDSRWIRIKEKEKALISRFYEARKDG